MLPRPPHNLQQSSIATFRRCVPRDETPFRDALVRATSSRRSAFGVRREATAPRRFGIVRGRVGQRRPFRLRTRRAVRKRRGAALPAALHKSDAAPPGTAARAGAQWNCKDKGVPRWSRGTRDLQHGIPSRVKKGRASPAARRRRGSVERARRGQRPAGNPPMAFFAHIRGKSVIYTVRGDSDSDREP